MSEETISVEIPVSRDMFEKARGKHKNLEQTIAKFINSVAEFGNGNMSHTERGSGQGITHTSGVSFSSSSSSSTGQSTGKSEGWVTSGLGNSSGSSKSPSD